MSLEAVNSKARSTIAQIGRAAFNSLYPKEFEYYLFALELVDSQGATVDYFSFPILPDQLKEVHREVTNVKKTLGGVSVIKNPTFVPRSINLSGTFGKKLKILIGGNNVTFAGFRFSVNSGKFKITPPGKLEDVFPVFSSFTKTGYGCIKIIEAMKDKSVGLDPFGKPYSLLCHNPIIGNSYQVEILEFEHQQDSDRNNTIPRYTLAMMAVAPLEAFSGFSRFTGAKNIGFSALQKKTNRVVTKVRRSIGL